MGKNKHAHITVIIVFVVKLSVFGSEGNQDTCFVYAQVRFTHTRLGQVYKKIMTLTHLQTWCSLVKLLEHHVDLQPPTPPPPDVTASSVFV